MELQTQKISNGVRKFHIILLSLLVLTNWLFAWRLQQTLVARFYYENALWTLGSFILFGIILSLVLILIKNNKLEMLTFAFGVAGFFINGFNVFIFGSVVLIFLSLLYTKRYIKKQLENLIKVRTYDILYYGIWYFMIAIFVTISAIYYTSPQLENYQFDLTVPSQFFDATFAIITPIIEEAGDAGINISHLTDSLQQQAQTMVNNSLESLVESYRDYIPGILVLSLFFGLQILNWPLRMVIAFFVALIIRPLIGFGVIKKETVQTEREILV